MTLLDWLPFIAIVAVDGAICFALGWYAAINPSTLRSTVTGVTAWCVGTLAFGVPLWFIGKAVYNRRHPEGTPWTPPPPLTPQGDGWVRKDSKEIK